MSPINICLVNDTVEVRSEYAGEDVVKAFFLSLLQKSTDVQGYDVTDGNFLIVGPKIKEIVKLELAQAKQIERIVKSRFYVQALGVIPEDGFVFIPR